MYEDISSFTGLLKYSQKKKNYWFRRLEKPVPFPSSLPRLRRGAPCRKQRQTLDIFDEHRVKQVTDPESWIRVCMCNN